MSLDSNIGRMAYYNQHNKDSQQMPDRMAI
jgi:hypothetical protein